MGPRAVEAATIFEGLSLAQNEQLYGSKQDVEPADAQIAASPSALVEVAENTMALFGSDGSLQWTVDIERLFQLPAGYDFYAPSLQYDWGSGRWFLGGIATNRTARSSWLLLAVSRSGNPLGTWSLFITDARADNPGPCLNPCLNNIYFMRESITVVADKVVQAVQAQNCSTYCISISGWFHVMRKDQAVGGAQPGSEQYIMGYGQEDFLAVPPQSVGGTYGDIAFVVWLKRGASVTMSPDRIGLLQITGLPDPSRFGQFNGKTVVWEKDFSASIPNGNTFAAQPGGSLYASPTPVTSAIYRDGQVVLAMNDACGQLDCLRIVKMSDFGNAKKVGGSNSGIDQNVTVPPPSPADLDRTLGLSGANLFDGSLAIDPYGNLFVGAAFSSSTQNPGMAVAGISAPINQTSTVMPTSRIVEGPSSYNCFTNSSNPWGAYMRSVPDPNNYRRVWMPAEAAVNSCWATAIVSATTGVGPQATKMSPAVGSTKGGQVVQIDGSFFVPDADQVLFGATPGTILAESSTTIIV
ncbi:MAG: IPT/TIG domain-containing protein, partial [Candidatus Dormibacteraeota bacterium]|nr:IPT/TIG domain-containing protein [Candidatus Dormibacteraeota bacterium]